METLLTSAYTHLDQKSMLLEKNSIAIGTIELLQRKIDQKHFFYKMALNGGYEMICTLSYWN